MRGTVRYIHRYHDHCSLIDENGVERSFNRSEIQADEDVENHDAVVFDLEGNKVVDIELLKKHHKGTVISFE